MKADDEKNLGTLVHIYDFLNGGYFSSHHQLKYYNEKAYNLYLNKDNDALLNLYAQKKILSQIQSSLLLKILLE